MDGYNVLRVCKLLKNEKKEGFIFKGKDGKVYFPSKKEEEFVKGLELDKTYLVWVIKEMSKFGYCRTNISGVLLRDYIDSLPSRTPGYYLNKQCKDVVRFSNEMYNNDIGFSTSTCNKCDNTSRDFEAVRRIDEIIERFGIESEDEEFRYELTVLDCYLYNLFNVIKFKG